MIKYTYVLLSLLLLSGCSSAFRDTSIINLDLDKIHSPDSKYGVVLFRPIYFENADPNYICKHKLEPIEWTNSLTVKVRPGYYGYYYISREPINEEKAVKFIGEGRSYVEGLVDFLTFTDQITLAAPEYFYGVRVMPEGRYYFRNIRCSIGRRDYKETEEVNYFDVKAGEVTYIGDYYWMNSVKFDRNFKDRLMSQTRGSVEIKLCDRFDEAKQFFQKYYSHVKLPIKKNLLKCCEAFKTN
ncbi:hypothetical protein [Candidatus Bandiella numerosa]|uniref:hypothetical protein n=1 Tax=Candidatus Bandiella numerosa TaxID=2570586 RepID=UPI001F1618E9|nr:hypothetical protein [Candidatus Bandiella numerosa]